MTRRGPKLTEAQLRRVESLIRDKGTTPNMIANNSGFEMKTTIRALLRLQDQGRARAQGVYWYPAKPGSDS